MINERILAEKFSVIWKEHFPLLTPNFMKVFNDTQLITINRKSIPYNSNVRYDLISEFSFNLACEISILSVTAASLFEDKKRVDGIIERTAKVIWKSGNYTNSDLLLNDDEVDQSKLICANIIEFAKKIKTNELYFKPQLKGFGVVPDLIADLSIDTMLVEIKTVNRTFRSSDLKQLILYLALQQVTGDMKWKFGALYNPRKGNYCKFNIKSLVNSLSGGKSPNEVFEKLLNSFTRDVMIDSKF